MRLLLSGIFACDLFPLDYELVQEVEVVDDVGLGEGGRNTRSIGHAQNKQLLEPKRERKIEREREERRGEERGEEEERERAMCSQTP